MPMKEQWTKRNDEAFAHTVGRARYPGLTKREYFASLAMTGLWGMLPINNHPLDATGMADVAVQLADALIEALNK